MSWPRRVAALLGAATLTLLGGATAATASVAPQPIEAQVSSRPPVVTTQQSQLLGQYLQQARAHDRFLPRGRTTTADVARPNVVGGKPVTITSAPWVVSVVSLAPDGTWWQCAGTLTAANQVVTAADCLQSPATGDSIDPAVGTYVIADSAAVNPPASTAITVPVDSGWIDPSFSTDSIGVPQSNVAVLNLGLSLPATLKPLPIAANNSQLWADGTTATAYGWGVTTAGGSSSSATSTTLQSVNLPIVDGLNCGLAVATFDSNTQICAGYAGGATTTAGTCFGDTGGPLVINNQLVGVDSFVAAQQCAPVAAYSYFSLAPVFAPAITAAPTADAPLSVAAADLPLVSDSFGTAAGALTRPHNSGGVVFTSGSQLLANATAANQSVSTVVDVGHATSYQVTAALTHGPSYGQVRLSVDGTVLGSTVDTYAKALSQPVSVTFGTVNLTAGPHTLTWTATGKNTAASSYQIGIDSIGLIRSDQAKGTAQPATGLTAATGWNATSATDTNSAGAKEVLITPTDPNLGGEQGALTISVATAGKYDLSAVYSTGPNRGVLTTGIDGTDTGSLVDAYAPAAGVRTVDLGRVTLTAGSHTFTMLSDRANPASSGTDIGIASLTLALVG